MQSDLERARNYIVIYSIAENQRILGSYGALVRRHLTKDHGIRKGREARSTEESREGEGKRATLTGCQEAPILVENPLCVPEGMTVRTAGIPVE